MDISSTSGTPTKSCFLDGRYIPLALADVEEFIPTPIVIQFALDKKGGVLSGSVSSDFFWPHENKLSIVRIVIRSPKIMHSALAWIDPVNKEITYTDTVRANSDEHTRKMRAVIDDAVGRFFSQFSDFSVVVERIVVPDVSRPDCEQYGYCNAYVIKQVLDYANDRAFDPSNILVFAGNIEREYKHKLDPNGEPEIEYHGGGGGGGRGGGGGGGGRGWGGGGGRGGGGGWGRGGGGWGGAGLGFGLAGGLLLGSALASPGYYYPQPYPYYPQPYPYGYGY